MSKETDEAYPLKYRKEVHEMFKELSYLHAEAVVLFDVCEHQYKADALDVVDFNKAIETNYYAGMKLHEILSHLKAEVNARHGGENDEVLH